jgi:hypothetical protein
MMTAGGLVNTIEVDFGAAQGAGHYNVVGVNYDPVGCGSVATVTDKMGNVYERLLDPLANGKALALETWGAANIAAAGAGANSVVVTFAHACGSRNGKVVEYAGVASSGVVEDRVALAGQNGDAPDAGLTTTSSAVLFAHTANEGAATDAGPGWTPLFTDDWGTLTEEQLVQAPGRYSATYVPGPGEQWVMQAVALRSCP